MLSGGEKAKIKNIVMAIKGEYPKILDVLDTKNFINKQDCIATLFDCNKKIFMWLAHIPTTIINNSEVLNKGFDCLQESNRFNNISVKEKKKVGMIVRKNINSILL